MHSFCHVKRATCLEDEGDLVADCTLSMSIAAVINMPFVCMSWTLARLHRPFGCAKHHRPSTGCLSMKYAMHLEDEGHFSNTGENTNELYQSML